MFWKKHYGGSLWIQQKHQQLALKRVRDGAQLRKAVRLLGFNKQEMAERTIWLQIYHIRLETGRMTMMVLQRPGRFHGHCRPRGSLLRARGQGCCSRLRGWSSILINLRMKYLATVDAQVSKFNEICPAAFQICLGPMIPFFFPYLRFGMGMSILCQPHIVLGKHITCCLVPQVCKWKEFLPQDNSYPESHS